MTTFANEILCLKKDIQDLHEVIRKHVFTISHKSEEISSLHKENMRLRDQITRSSKCVVNRGLPPCSSSPQDLTSSLVLLPLLSYSNDMAGNAIASTATGITSLDRPGSTFDQRAMLRDGAISPHQYQSSKLQSSVASSPMSLAYSSVSYYQRLPAAEDNVSTVSDIVYLF